MKKYIYALSIFTAAQLLSISTQGQTYTISSIAGNGVGSYSGDGAAATSAEIKGPCDAVTDASGNVYIADQSNQRIRVVRTTGVIATLAGNGTAGYSGDGGICTSAEVNYPAGLAFDASGNLYIADSGNNRIRKITTSGIISTVAGNGTAGFGGDGAAATSAELKGPTAIAFDLSGNMYIVDSKNNRIRKVNTSGVISTIAGNGTVGYSGDGAAATSAELYNPWGIAVDASGNVYVADVYNNRVRKINTSGIISTIAGNGTAGYSGDGAAATSAELHYPYGVGVDASGNIYIADASNNRIRKVNTSGVISTVAGNGTAGYSGDGGAATSAEINAPASIKFDASGNGYIADESNNRIRKLLAPTGVAENNFSTNVISVFPNPSNGVFIFSQKNNFQKSSLEIYNVLGEKIISTTLTSSQTQVNLSNKAKGVYFYKVISEDGNNVSSGKIIVE